MASLGQWQFTPTLRMDHQWLTPLDGSNDSNHSWHLSPSLATSYRFNDQWRSWLSYANGFRAPSYDKVYGNIPTTSPCRPSRSSPTQGSRRKPATA